MKNIVLLLCIVTASCSGPKKTAENTAADPVPVKDSMLVETAQNCLGDMIKGFEKEEKQNPPRKIYRYNYKGKTVYYVTAPCCDFYSDLYDSTCTLIGHPDGGFTGKGDGRWLDFNSNKSNEKLVWEDKRK